ncbi:MAG TPA: hypothetical protein VFE53_00330 [Mucilaginibacter sp.]|nr:hypothetical protein [Mucilaginibacter sp.]
MGTIHPHTVTEFVIEFYYGNVGSLWNILSEAFPDHNFQTVESILKTLDQHDVWITDLVSQCDRDNEKVTQDKYLRNLKFNKEAIQIALKYGSVDKIFFTSAFGKNNAAKLFTDLFQVDYKATYNEATREFLIPAKHFGRRITGVVLFSPSGQANIGISKSSGYLKEINFYKQFKHPVKQFKIDFYRKKFDFLAVN